MRINTLEKKITFIRLRTCEDDSQSVSPFHFIYGLLCGARSGEPGRVVAKSRSKV
jgi:hypothetical protein